MKSRKWITGAFAIALGGMSQLASGTTVSVNFVGGQGGNGTGGGSGTVTGPAGYNNASNWNNAVPAAGSLPGAIDDSGASAASVTWNSGNTWAATGAAPAGGGSATMMSGYLDNFGNAGNNATVTGLGSAFTSKGYDVIVYFNSDSAGTQGFSATDNAANTATAFGNQAGGGGTNFPLAGPNGFILSTQTANNTTFGANAVRLTGLTGDSFTLTGVNGAVGDGRARINGFQIINDLGSPTGKLIVPGGGVGVVQGQAFIADRDGNATNAPVAWKLEQFNVTAGLKTEWYNNANVDTTANINNFLAGNPAPTVTFQSNTVAFGGPVGFPTEITDLGIQGNGNRVVRYTGQIFISESGLYRFKDGVDQSTQLVIGGQTIINDQLWTNFDGTGGDNGGSAINQATFNVAAGGEWLDFSFIMGEICCGNQASLFWDYDEALGLGANPDFPGVFTSPAGLGALIESGRFRSLDLIASISGTDPIDGVFQDGVGNTILFNADGSQALRLTVEGEGLTFVTSALITIPEPGTISLLGLAAVGLIRRRRHAA